MLVFSRHSSTLIGEFDLNGCYKLFNKFMKLIIIIIIISIITYTNITYKLYKSKKQKYLGLYFLTTSIIVNKIFYYL